MTTTHVLVTTDASRRGVFAGILESNDGAGNVVLINAQMCIYWSKETRGVLGLAVTGPALGSRVGPPVARLELNGVTAIAAMSVEAVKGWSKQPWT